MVVVSGSLERNKIFSADKRWIFSKRHVVFFKMENSSGHMTTPLTWQETEQSWGDLVAPCDESITVKPLLRDTFIQGTLLFRAQKILSRKNVHIIFVFATSMEGTLLFTRGKGHFFWIPKPGVNLHLGETLAIKKWLTTKIIDKLFKRTLVTVVTAFKTRTISLKSMYCTFRNSTHNRRRDNLTMIFYTLPSCLK